MKYYLIAGEASGDLQGRYLVRALRQQDPVANIRCWGGDGMQEEGATVVKHFRDLAFMGFFEVIKNLPTILRNLRFCKEDIASFQPDVLILIDYPGFNLRIAQWAKKAGYKVIYYISPQVWAWKSDRVKIMKQCIDRLLVILPFENEYYKKHWNWEVDYVGHPLAQVTADAIASHKPTSDPTRQVALLPGSRKQEIQKKLPVMLSVSKYFPNHTFVVAAAPGLDLAFYNDFLQNYPNVQVRQGHTYDIVLDSDAALVTSGTATLETALLGIPEAVCYKGNPISYQIAKRLIKIPYISLVNLILNKLVVREFIQEEMNEQNLRNELQALLQEEEKRKKMKADFQELRTLLEAGGSASDNAARIIVRTLAK
ncbi:MAG: lipid-A-disaccharide synthase [Bacteroidota bacterium]